MTIQKILKANAQWVPCKAITEIICQDRYGTSCNIAWAEGAMAGTCAPKCQSIGQDPNFAAGEGSWNCVCCATPHT